MRCEQRGPLHRLELHRPRRKWRKDLRWINRSRQQVLVAGRYITREEFNTVLNQVFAKLDTIRDLVSQKADR